MNSLSQTLLKMTSPGIPDVYQGNEIWDFSLVDPDLRRPVDFEKRKRLLAALRALDPSDVSTLLKDGVWQDGRPKLYLTQKALEPRRKSPELFADGAYKALEISGTRKDNLVAFARKHGQEVAIKVAPRLDAKITPVDGSLLSDQEAWRDTSILLPHELAGVAYRNVLSGETTTSHKHDGRPSLHAARSSLSASACQHASPGVARLAVSHRAAAPPCRLPCTAAEGSPIPSLPGRTETTS